MVHQLPSVGCHACPAGRCAEPRDVAPRPRTTGVPVASVPAVSTRAGARARDATRLCGPSPTTLTSEPRMAIPIVAQPRNGFFLYPLRGFAHCHRPPVDGVPIGRSRQAADGRELTGRTGKHLVKVKKTCPENQRTYTRRVGIGFGVGLSQTAVVVVIKGRCNFKSYLGLSYLGLSQL